jgi:hypothetical protein
MTRIKAVVQQTEQGPAFVFNLPQALKVESPPVEDSADEEQEDDYLLNYSPRVLAMINRDVSRPEDSKKPTLVSILLTERQKQKYHEGDRVTAALAGDFNSSAESWTLTNLHKCRTRGHRSYTTTRRRIEGPVPEDLELSRKT